MPRLDENPTLLAGQYCAADRVRHPRRGSGTVPGNTLADLAAVRRAPHRRAADRGATSRTRSSRSSENGSPIPTSDVVISTGGTGVTGREPSTPEAFHSVYEKEIAGFWRGSSAGSAMNKGSGPRRSRAGPRRVVAGPVPTCSPCPDPPSACRDAWGRPSSSTSSTTAFPPVQFRRADGRGLQEHLQH